MAGSKSYPNSFHFFGFAGQPGAVYEDALCFVKGSEFSGNAEVETEEDKGHTGSRSLLIGEDRVSGSATPEVKDKLRLELGLEDYFHHLLGDYTLNAIGTKTKEYVFAQNEDLELPLVSYIHGYNGAEATARGFKNGMLNELEISISSKEAPTITPKYISDFPTYGLVNPTITFPATFPRAFSAKDLAVKIGTAGATPATDLGCVLDGSITLGNNLELSECVNLAIDETAKDAGDFTAEGSLNLRYNETNATLEREWATGSASGSTLTAERLLKSLGFTWTGAKIETVAGTPNVDHYNQLAIIFKNADLTKVAESESGEDAKSIAVDFKATDVEITTKSQLTALHIGT